MPPSVDRETYRLWRFPNRTYKIPFGLTASENDRTSDISDVLNSRVGIISTGEVSALIADAGVGFALLAVAVAGAGKQDDIKKQRLSDSRDHDFAMTFPSFEDTNGYMVFYRRQNNPATLSGRMFIW